MTFFHWFDLFSFVSSLDLCLILFDHFITVCIVLYIRETKKHFIVKCGPNDINKLILDFYW